ncbi:hypothetical protein QOM_3334 [Clostridioides difficile Y155]|nr:hypothetical protein [Clostridioides difficile]EQI19228.1 hypothetical protein QOM_3334 [Clostridioides difficile Y155]
MAKLLIIVGILGWIALIVSLFIYKKAKNEKVKLFKGLLLKIENQMWL